MKQPTQLMRPGQIQKCNESNPIHSYLASKCADAPRGESEVISQEQWEEDYRCRRGFAAKFIESGSATTFADPEEKKDYFW